MNKYLVAVGLVVLGAVVGGVSAVVVNRPIQTTGGDFPGGVLPTNLFTGNAAGGYVQAAGNLGVAAYGGVFVGGTAPANQTVLQYTATTTYPAATFTLGAVSAATSTTSTAITIPSVGFSVGDPCSEVSYNGVSSTQPLVSYDANISAIGGGNATATVIFFSASQSTQTFNVTSSATGVSSTLKVTCRHAGV